MLTPHLCEQALAHFEARMRDTETFLEYGIGGSTLRALELGVKNVIVAESDPFWANKIKLLADRITQPYQNLHIVCVDFGEMGSWGTPLSPTLDTAKRYIEGVWDLASSLNLVPNTVLIDGRFRVACGCESILKCGKDTQILLDDAFRDSYINLREILEETSSHGRLLSFKRGDMLYSDVEECKKKNLMSVE